MKSSDIPVHLLTALFNYDPETGVLVWRKRALSLCKSEREQSRWNTRYAGKVAGGGNAKGYSTVKVFGTDVQVHRICYALGHGRHSIGPIDHIDHDTTNNRINNLRETDYAGNARNSSKPSDNRSGVVGVLKLSNGKWRAQIGFNRRHYFLGDFPDFSTAVVARKSAQKVLGFHENHGKAR